MDPNKYVSSEELLALTKKAFENDEVAEFLCGEKDYGVHGNRDIPAEIPTDFNRIRHMIYRLYSQTHSKKIIVQFRMAIENLTDTPVHVWCAFMEFSGQIITEHCKEYPPPFWIADDDDLINKMRANLYNSEAALRNCKEYLGINKANGLWDYITHLNSVIMKEYVVSIL